MLSPLRKRAGQRLREPFGKAGLTVAVIALVFAMLGGAYAATGLNSKQKKEVKSIAKSFQGTGSAGAAGAKGDNGSNGAQGAKGDTGVVGPQGPQGSQGKQGTQGPAGEAGMCSAAKPECKLATGGVLTGVWSATGSRDVVGITETTPPVLVTTPSIGLAAISFPVRVSPAPTAIGNFEFAAFTIGYQFKNGAIGLYGPYPCLEGCEGHGLLEQGEMEEILSAAEEAEDAYREVCPGDANNPKAKSGFLCIYRLSSNGNWSSADSSSAAAAKSEVAHEFGVTVPFQFSSADAFVRGSWAVTG